MKLALAVVKNNIDIYNSGSLKAVIEGCGNEIRPVLISAPFHSGDGGALKTPSPKVNSTIIVCKPEGSPEWIYLATCEGLVWQGQGALTKNKFIPTMARGVDRSGKSKQASVLDRDFVIKTDGNYGLEFVQRQGSNEPLTYSKVFTGAGKFINLDDTPSQDSITLQAGEYSSFKLTNFPASRSLCSMGAVLETLGPQRFVNRESKTTIAVENGTELNLINNSTGTNAIAEDKLFAGNINLQTGTGDINLFTKSAGGKIFIECLPATVALPNQEPINDIVIRAGSAVPTGVSVGRVTIEASEIQLTTSNLSVLSQGDINMQSLGSINMFGALGVNITSGASIALQAPKVDLNPPTPVAPPVVANLTNFPSSRYLFTGVLFEY